MIHHKTFFKITLFVTIASASYSCLIPEKKRVVQIDTTKTGSGIDSVLSVQLGADEYGMKNYVMALLKRGPRRWMIDSVMASNLQKAHIANIGRLADEGKLVVAGPFTDTTDLKGIYVFDVKTIEEAQKLCETDPAIKAGSLMMELHPWYGSAAMLQIPAIHNKIAKKQP
ncbi:MAG: YciI family protein [Emticicia sp.]